MRQDNHCQCYLVILIIVVDNLSVYVTEPNQVVQLKKRNR